MEISTFILFYKIMNYNWTFMIISYRYYYY